jgi:hypothetical protein
LLRLKSAVQSSAFVRAEDINNWAAVAQPRLRAWLGALSDHDLVMAIDASDEIAYSQPGLHMSAELIGAATARSVRSLNSCAAARRCCPTASCACSRGAVDAARRRCRDGVPAQHR